MNRRIRMGGMGVYMTTPFLARIVSLNGGIGTVSGAMVDQVLVRILQQGDIGGHYRRALAHFPFPAIAEKVLDKYFEPNPGARPMRHAPLLRVNPDKDAIALIVCANFALVWLAKEGHNNPIAINYLEKIQIPHIYALTGAMLAGVDQVSMGAGIPTQIPGVIDIIASGGNPSYHVNVENYSESVVRTEFNVDEFFGESLAGLRRPDFLPIITTDALAQILLKRSTGSIQGFVVEKPIAGGHNAPPRGGIKLDDTGEPIYSERDSANLEKMRAIGLPFWIGGGYASPDALKEAISSGAAGVQIGSAFALSRESGMRDDLRRHICTKLRQHELYTRTDLLASPTGFPFKVMNVGGTVGDRAHLLARTPRCNIGSLLRPYMDAQQSLGYRCPAEPLKAFLAKGGKVEDTDGVCCLCNGLLGATILAEAHEAAVITLGNDTSFIHHIPYGCDGEYGAIDVIKYLES